jgi:diguanylate cyclase (GGDEF)-like protein/PAS domain S-box-containing protein
VSLRAKTLVILGATLLGLTALLALVARTLVMAGFEAIEVRAVRENLERARLALAEEMEGLAGTARDYAVWDETYRFVEDRHPDYLVRQLPTQDQSELRVAVVALADLRGKVLHDRFLDFAGKRQLPLPPQLALHFLDQRLLFRDPAARRGRAGILVLPQGDWMVACWPILDNSGAAPARGTLVMARPLDAGVVREIARRTQLEVQVRRLVEDDLGAWAGAAGGELVRTESDQLIEGRAVLEDVHARPALTLTVQMPRPIHQRALATLNYFTAFLLLAGLVFGGSMLGLIEKVVLSRLQRLGAGLKQIRERRDLRGRVEAPGADELSELGTSVNDLLDAVEGSQRELAAAERERYALAAAAANDGLWDWDVAGGTIYYSPRFNSMLGYGDDAPLPPVPEAWLARVHPEDREALQRKLDDALAGAHAEHEHRLLREDGSYVHVLGRWVTLRGPDGAVTRRVGSLSDVTARREAEERLRRDALYDALTGLANRTLLLDRVRRGLARAKRHGQACALLFIDLDRFKLVNDSLGHRAGDELLREAARRIQASVRPEDTVARLGGDEFNVLLEGVRGPTDATHAAERIQGGIARPFRLGETELFVTASIGIAISSGDQQDPADLIRDADTAMYQAKAEGKARHQLFDKRMHEQVMNALSLEYDLRRALERGELEMRYQPIVRLEGAEIVGFEALVRWRHATRGVLAPGEFIPMAEETGLIVPIGRWVLERACADAQAWLRDFPRDPPLTLSVNLSARQLIEPDLVGTVEDVLRRTGFDPRSLQLEITESVIIQRPDLVSVVLNQLKELGVGVSIDDFGTGYSSLNHLHLFPIDCLKIDRSFVSSMTEVMKQRRIVESIVMLGRNLGIDVVAEGVEREPQREALRGFGCASAQGFLFSEPVDAECARSLVVAGAAGP